MFLISLQNASDEIQEVEEKKTNGDDNNVMEVEIDDEKENGEIEEVQTLHDNILVFRFQKQ